MFRCQGQQVFTRVNFVESIDNNVAIHEYTEFALNKKKNIKKFCM